MLENFGWSRKDEKDAESAFKGTAFAVRCYETHPVLKIGKGKLYGGSASHPVVKDADVYVALQHGSTSGKISDPWDDKHVVVEVQYSIRDMHAPEHVARFKKMITWLCTQLHEGKTVHVGCIGGHGRTGTVLSAIVAEALEKKDAIHYVRKHYCKKAVESRDQIKFLMKHYGVSEAESSKSEVKKWEGSTQASTWASGVRTVVAAPEPKVRPVGAKKSYEPMASARSLWKTRK